MDIPFINLEGWIKERLFDAVPMSIAVIDPQFNIVAANRAFEEMFGEWKHKKCHSVYKNSDSICMICAGGEAFRDGKPRSNEEVGYAKDGTLTRYMKYTIPIKDDNGNIPFLIEMSTDITDYDKMKRELQVLFDQVPCNITVLDKDLRIVRANKIVYDKFGDVKNQHCFDVFKNRKIKCEKCPIQKTFKDGKSHTGRSVVKNKKGEQIHFHVTSTPLEQSAGEVDLVMEMTVDISENVKLQDELSIAYSFLETLIGASFDGIIATDKDGNVTVFNKAAKELFNVDKDQNVTKEELASMFPEGFLAQVAAGPGHVYLPDSYLNTIDKQKIPARLVGVKLTSGEKMMGMAFSVQDLLKIKELERANLEAERLAAVGQTVAGLAHGVKNLIAGLEGGMYMLNTGINKGESERIVQGWDILDRNIVRISTFVKAFLSFSRGHEFEVALTDPAKVAKEVVDLYSINAQNQGIELSFKKDGEIKQASINEEGIHESLTNLVGNAIDACQMSDREGDYHVKVRIFEEDDNLIYEVSDDGCGMDYEIKKKVFTNFFTSKGLGGTGIGLLQTRKIIQEHGGHIDIDSEPGKGSTFKVVLPRLRLPKPKEQKNN